METVRPNSATDHVRPGLIPTEDDLFWVAAMREAIVGGSRGSQWGAAGIAAASVFGVMIILFAQSIAGPTGVIARVLWIVPLVLWGLAFLWSVRAFGIRRYRYFANSPDSARQAIIRIARRRADQLYWATGFWAAGLLTVIVALLHDAVSTG